MNELRFVWDQRKDLATYRKHGVRFEEARTAFYDENAKVFFDPDHPEDEDRFILMGISLYLRVLVVCHCYREAESVVRIISARKADKRERESYWSCAMREHYDFSKMKAKKNPYVRMLKRSVTIRLDRGPTGGRR